MKRLANFALILMLASCNSEEILTTEELSSFCESQKGKRVPEDELIDKFQHLRLTREDKEDTLYIKIVSPDHYGLDTCFYNLTYDKAHQTLTDYFVSCQ